MAVLLPPGRQRYFNNIGTPLIGGKLYTYEPGTATPRNTYADPAGTVPNTNPVILDANGEATVFWSGAYKVILQDATGVIQWTVDGLSSIPDGGSAAALASDLASLTVAGKGAALIGRGQQLVPSVAALRSLLKTTPSVTAATAGYATPGDGGGGNFYLDPNDSTSVDDGATVIVASDGGRWKLNLSFPVNLRQFGASPSATAAVNTAAINAAFTWSGAVRVPVVDYGGSYPTNAPLLFPDNATFHGAGKNKTIFRPAGTFAYGFLAQGTSFNSYGSNRVGSDFDIDGSLGFTGTGCGFINLGLRCRFADIFVYYCTGNGIYTQGSFDHSYDRLETRYNTGLGIWNFEKQLALDGVYEETSKLVFTDCSAINNNSGGIQWRVEGGDSFSFNECKPSEGTIGIHFTGRPCTNHHIRNMMHDSPHPSPGTSTGIKIDHQYAQAITIEGAECYNSQYGIQVTRGGTIYVKGSVQMFSGGLPVQIDSTADGPVYIEEFIGYFDARATANKQSYPQDWMGTWPVAINGSGSTIGNGTITATYIQNGHLVHFTINFVFGSTSVFGSGTGFSLPFPAVYFTTCAASVFQKSSNIYSYLQCAAFGQALQFPFSNVFLNGTTPITWAAGDRLDVSGTFRIA